MAVSEEELLSVKNGFFSDEEEHSPTDTSEDSVDIKVSAVDSPSTRRPLKQLNDKASPIETKVPSPSFRHQRKLTEPQNPVCKEKELDSRTVDNTKYMKKKARWLSQALRETKNDNETTKKSIKRKEEDNVIHEGLKKKLKKAYEQERERDGQQRASLSEEVAARLFGSSQTSFPLYMTPPAPFILPFPGLSGLQCPPSMWYPPWYLGSRPLTPSLLPHSPLAVSPPAVGSPVRPSELPSTHSRPLENWEEEEEQTEPLALVKQEVSLPRPTSSKNSSFSVESLLADHSTPPPLPRVFPTAASTSWSEPQVSETLDDDSGCSSKQRNYKNMTRERRVEANARERTRVHTISAAFENLRSSIPCYSNSQKLSKLSILRVACAYILALSRLAGYDYSAEQNQPSFEECVEYLTMTIQTESRAKKRRDDS